LRAIALFAGGKRQCRQRQVGSGLDWLPRGSQCRCFCLTPTSAAATVSAHSETHCDLGKVTPAGVGVLSLRGRQFFVDPHPRPRYSLTAISKDGEYCIAAPATSRGRGVSVAFTHVRAKSKRRHVTANLQVSVDDRLADRRLGGSVIAASVLLATQRLAYLGCHLACNLGTRLCLRRGAGAQE
jgi:hypothetical protein